MTHLNLTRILLSASLFIIFSVISTYLINPNALVNFIGPSAAFISGLLILWGWSAIVAVVIASPILALILTVYFEFDANFAVMVIAVLVISLQAIWTKQLVFHVIESKQWLTSRKHLSLFLLRIGPLASLVSASSVLVISILDNQVITGSFVYTFINTWATSMLVAVFITPLLLMAKNNEQFSLTKRLIVTFTSVLGGIAIFLLLKTSQLEQQQLRKELFNQSKAEVKRLIQDEIDEVINNVNSLSALFKADRYVSSAEFNLFSESIFKEESSVRALEWAPIIKQTHRSEFEQENKDLFTQNFHIKERNNAGNLVVAQTRNEYAPIRFLYPKQGNQAVMGLDVFTNPNHILPMQKVIASQDVVASAPLTLIQGEEANLGVLFSRSVFLPSPEIKLPRDAHAKKLPLEEKGSLLGFIVAVVQFDTFFQRLANDKSQQVTFKVQDVSSPLPFTLYGHALSTKNRYVESTNLSVFSRVWQIDIAEKQPWFSQSKGWQTWAILIGGTFGGVLFQMLILMMAAYSSELTEQVNSKTRALILAKENSEKKNLAKSHFLQTLNTELRVQLLAVKSGVEKLKEKGINNKELAGISHAGNNVALLLDNMVDLSDIESGKTTAKAEPFDLYGFLHRTESVLKASHNVEVRSIIFLIDENVPHFINSDELYIQKLLHSLIESAHQVLKSDMLRLSVKLHKHTQEDASLFFTISSQNPTSGVHNFIEQPVSEELVAHSTELAMAIKYSQLLGGDTSLGQLSSGAGVLNASIKVIISSAEQQEEQQKITFDLH